MRKTVWMAGLGALALALTVSPGAARAQAVRDIPGPIDSLRDLQDTGRMLFMMADANHDGQISQQEAIDAANLTLGGFFFRADASGDGTLSRDEARAARDTFFQANPWVRYVVETMRADQQRRGAQGGQGIAGGNQPTNAASALSGAVTAFDTNNDKQLQATELRQAIATTVQGAFASADTNRDGQLSPSEVNAALVGGARAVAQATFQQADTDNDGTLSEAEFDQAFRRPVHVMFTIIDLNHDGKLSQEEVQRVRRAMISRLQAARVPEPQNSLRNLLRSGERPSEAAPVPSFGAPSRPRPAGTPAPAPGTAPAPGAAQPATPAPPQ